MKNVFINLSNLKKYTNHIIISVLIGFTLIYVVIFTKFISLFSKSSYSDNPSDWYEFIGMITGTISLIITGIIAWQVQIINKRTTSKFARLPYTIKAYDQFKDLTINYYNKRAKFINLEEGLFHITKEYNEEVAKFKYFERIYFSEEIYNELDKYQKFLNKYYSWLESQKENNSQLDFMFDHSIYTREMDDKFSEITKKIQTYINTD